MLLNIEKSGEQDKEHSEKCLQNMDPVLPAFSLFLIMSAKAFFLRGWAVESLSSVRKG